MPATTAARSSAALLPGPAKLMDCASIAASRATRNSPAEATSNPSTMPAMCRSSAGIGICLHRIVQVDLAGQRVAQLGNPIGQRLSIVDIDWRAPGAGDDLGHRAAADQQIGALPS